ncbi:SDR family oxidoreductase [candidate division KSB1 bacterium]
MNSLKGKTVFITGASAGIGMACAECFAEAGSRIVLTARREDRLQEAAKLLNEKYSSETLIRKMDVTDNNEVKTVIGGLPEDWKDIDILINNSGLAFGMNKIHESDPDDWDVVIDTNVKGMLYVARAIIPGMVERGSGHIFNLGSIAGHQVYPNGSVYCSTKFAVNALTQGMQMELVDTPLRVTCISPGMVETEFSEVRFRGDKQKAAKVYKGIDALTGTDIAEIIVFIAGRPKHVNINDVIIMPTNQASAIIVHKK